MVLVVILEPSGELAERGERIWQGIDANIVAFEGFDEALRHAIRLGALDWREAGNEIERCGEVARRLGCVGAAIVCQPFERRRRLEGAKPPLDGLEHHVPDHPAADARSDDGMPCDDFPVMGVDDEGDPDEVPVPARDLEPV